MKKLLVFLLICLSSTALFAQKAGEHWTPVTGNQNTMTMTAVLVIDGEEVGADALQLEIGFFDQDGVCRGAKLPKLKSGHYRYSPSIHSIGSNQHVTCRIWDHSTDTERTDLTFDMEPLLVQPGEQLGSSSNLYQILFTTGSTQQPEEYTWNVPETGWDVPAEGSNVTIPDNSIVIIPADVTANALEITLPSNSSIVIEEGGALYHTNVIPVTLNMIVNGYNNTTKLGVGGYRFIAAPINPSIAVIATTLATPGTTYDLYSFNEAEEGAEWRNYEAGEFANLEIGKGYLYANAVNDTIAFTGATKPTNENETVNLSYTSGNNWAGFNLIGNPFTCKAYINRPFYRMKADGTDVNPTEETGTAINPLEAVLVQATELGQTCEFTTTAPTAKGVLNIAVSENNSLVDVASLCFGKGINLSKRQFNPNHTKVYMTQESKDYAVLHTENQGEMPVNFKAEENGTYTLSFNNVAVDFEYLHLIDNMTGTEVDLLTNPSYSFNAKNTDYASRFRLVYATGNNTNDDFAFISNGELLILGLEGQATLQVIDVTGRVLSSETISGNYRKAVNASTGVYMLRLINGNETRTQKIVVK